MEKGLANLALGIALLAMGLGVLWPWIEYLGLDKWGLGRAPGDLTFDVGDMRVHLPLGSAVIITAALAAVLLIGKNALG